MTSDDWLKERAKRLWKVHARNIHHETLRSLKATVLAFGQEAIERERERLLDRLRNPDEALVEAVAKALWRLECSRADADERRAARTPPGQWADPWHESGCGVRQRKPYMEAARESIAALARTLEGQEDDDPCHGPEDTTCPSCGLGSD